MLLHQSDSNPILSGLVLSISIVAYLIQSAASSENFHLVVPHLRASHVLKLQQGTLQKKMA